MSIDHLITKFRSVDTTAICDADKSIRVLDSGIRARSAETRMLGPAFTVHCRGDFFGVLRAIEAASPGEVVVVDGGGAELAYAGELFARGAVVRGLAGIIVDGGYRDIGYVRDCPLPIYSRFVTPMAGTTGHLGALQIPVTCGGVRVAPGDLVLADDEGVIVLDPERAEELLDAAAAIKNAEAGVIARLDKGDTLSDSVNVDAHAEALGAGEPSVLRFLD
ncbi:RraA family protein [Nocardia sp. 2]|uniref:Putative 4-hydroxy-4-methyl-2-oxoglutarate aldolase n=1 Tax=Nocardia acididurans TaxID=2802282 RepID=A0ABS1M7B9_9NOCA|nr:RraA family protein [Nocardia acididurans]MBL1076542.1 RraA family protein [Nocardia acididurans]